MPSDPFYMPISKVVKHFIDVPAGSIYAIVECGISFPPPQNFCNFRIKLFDIVRTTVHILKMKEIRKSDIFIKWFEKLKDLQAMARIDARIDRLAQGNSGDSRFLGDISELRIDYGSGYRVYYKDTGKKIIVLLCGGDKSTQRKDILKAREISRFYEEE